MIKVLKNNVKRIKLSVVPNLILHNYIRLLHVDLPDLESDGTPHNEGK